jgi:hypothetical protein
MNSRHNWDNSSHQQLYDRIHGNGGFFLPDGAGVSGADGTQDGWAELAALMARARERTEAALARAGAVWEGGAADGMRFGVTPLAQWADDANVASTASQASTDIHVSSYAAAKNQMPEPVPVTSTANGDFGGIPAGFTHLLGGQTDQDRQEAAAQEAKAEAVRVMSGYEGESGIAQATVGRFVPPPSVTVDVPVPQPKGGDVIPVGVSEWPGSGQPVDDSTRSAGDTRGPGATPPPPGGSSTPPPGNNSSPSGTAPSAVTPTSPSVRPSFNPPTTGFVPDQQRAGLLPFTPGGTGGAPGERAAGGTGRGPVGGGGDTRQGPGGTGRGPGGAGPGVRGAAPVGGLAGEPVAGRAGAGGVRGANGMGMGPLGGRTEGDEDKEHKTAEYLQSTHDDFWDDTPPVAPAVIGDEDDD